MKNTIDNRKRFWILCVCVCCMLGVSVPEKRVQAATTCSSAISFPGKTSYKVNMRKKAGTSYKSYGYVENNSSITVLGYVTSGGVKWYKCKGKVNGKTKTGYIHSAYVKLTFPVQGTVNSKVTTTLNVRKSQKTTSKSLGKIKKDAKVTVQSLSKKSSTYWYKISTKIDGKTVKGYVSGKYITVKEVKPNVSGNANSNDNTSSTKTGYVNDNVSTTLNVRKEASTSSSILMKIPRETKVKILSASGDWYKVTVTYNGSAVTGYVYKQYITIVTDSKSDAASETNFDTSLKEFPADYQTLLQALQKEYPSWKFVAIKTNLDWNDVIRNESVVGRNVIQSNYPKGTSSLAPFSYLSTQPGAYKWNTDVYTVKDGTNWYCANSNVIAYYMDPRNFLNGTDIFQFEALAYDSSQSEQVVQSILSNTFMKGKYSVKDSATGKTASGTYTQAFMDAGKNAKANPYFLATRVKQEVGVNGSNATSGTYKGYEGIYNFYNIGANDGANAVANGLTWAKGGSNNSTTYGRPWTTPYKSIVGGAQYIAANYINKGQNTLYLQKFNVMPIDQNQLYLHQYMTNVQAPYSEGKTTRNAYNTLGILNDSMVFYIPVYNNMPATPCALPASTGNPNAFLSDISVYNGNTKINMSATFVKPTEAGELSNNTYSMVVAKGVSQVTIKATPVSSKATVTGVGVVALKAAGQTTSVKVTGIAQNGKQQEYVLNITRDTK